MVGRLLLEDLLRRQLTIEDHGVHLVTLLVLNMVKGVEGGYVALDE